MKTLLVYPRFFPYSSPPLGLVYIAASMRKAGLKMELFDGTFRTKEDFMKKVKSYRPDIIAFTIMTRNLRDVKELIKQIREFDRNIKTVAGGPHPSVMPEDMMNNYDIDIVVVGEGELTMVELVKALENRNPLETVKGIYYKENGAIKTTGCREPIENLDALPFPARDLLDMKKYLGASIGRSSWTVPRPSTTIITSRGCPYSCTFCAARLIHGKKVRKRSPENIVDEIEELVTRYKIRGLWINDDSFTVDKKWVMGIMYGMKERGIELGFGCNTRVNLVSAELLKEMKKGGCRFISFGVESGSQYVLDKYLKKRISLNQVERAFRLASRAGIVTQATFMVGTPGETIHDIHQSLLFAKRIKPDSIQVAITTPLPGTEIIDIAEELGEIDIKDWEKIDYMWNGVIRTKDFTPEVVRELQRKFLFKFYFRAGYFLTQIRRMHSVQDMLTRARGIRQLFGGNVSPLSFSRKE